MENIGVLIVAPVNSYLEEELDKRFNLLRLWNFPHKDEFFKHHSGSIRAVVGYPNFVTDREFIDSFPVLEIISSFSVGVNQVDLAYCKEKGIRVTNTPEINTDDVADVAIGLILTTLRGICESDRFVRGGLWKKGYFKLTTKALDSSFVAPVDLSQSTSVMENIGVLIVAPVNSYLGEELDKRFNLIRLWNFPQKDDFFKNHSDSIRAVVGYPNFVTDREFIDSFPVLEIISSFSVGVNHVDLAYCKEKGIRVTNTPEINTDDVADVAIGLILTTLRGICESDRFVRGGLWKKGDFKLTTKMLFTQLSGRIVDNCVDLELRVCR
ncbi:hypothetical protein L1987_70572 [Smallanthus sonchifolius]|uniref:Uncharacterized protein n=1 Tax=Smallanthus sonchifolius TaxID=185202 RepID=A0ACB9ARL4_9ASTR|nr:hypothetical protein L1987_70572 [Smallanthus sonchifolius]